jgi:hypothetical protein
MNRKRQRELVICARRISKLNQAYVSCILVLHCFISELTVARAVM